MTGNSNKQPLSATELKHKIEHYKANPTPSLQKRVDASVEQVVAHWVINREIVKNQNQQSK